jgi:hypothetical protein
MPRPGKTRSVTARNPDADIYDRYAVGLYRQALLGRLAHAGARAAPGLRRRDVTSLVRAVLQSLTRRHENPARPT